MRAPGPLRLVALMLSVLALGACSKEGGLQGAVRSLRAGHPPDEFAVLPTKPLEMPSDMAALPPPTPGAPNRVAFDPEAEAVASLTGRTGPAGTAKANALVARAGPADPNVRVQLAAEDATWRKEHPGKLLPRLFTKDDTTLIYQGLTLDSGATFVQLRSAGVGVPPAPPAALIDEPVVPEQDNIPAPAGKVYYSNH